MVLLLVGIGLFDEKDITLRGLEDIKRADRVYLENYTSILGINPNKLVCYRHRSSPSAPHRVGDLCRA